jgi:hypothetical protein
MVLLSPAIGVSPAAAFAWVQESLARLGGFEKAAWTDILPEYDPYKYNSFTANAGDQMYRLTQRIDSQLRALGSGGLVKGMPRILAFQSAADATVLAPAVVNTLFRRLAPEGHEIVFFDINRQAELQPLFDPAVLAMRAGLFDGPALPFDLTGLTNADAQSSQIVALHRRAESTEVVREATDLEWPRHIFSLSHVALPFPPDDPVYGAGPPKNGRIHLGQPELLGERGFLGGAADGADAPALRPVLPVRRATDRGVSRIETGRRSPHPASRPLIAADRRVRSSRAWRRSFAISLWRCNCEQSRGRPPCHRPA